MIDTNYVKSTNELRKNAIIKYKVKDCFNIQDKIFKFSCNKSFIHIKRCFYETNFTFGGNIFHG